jgi:hypothetical protein
VRPPNGMSGGPLVQDFRGEVRSAGPGDRPDFGIDPDLSEGIRGPQGREYPSPVTHMRQVHVTGQAIGKRQPEPVVAQHLNISHVDTPNRAGAGAGALRGDGVVIT